MLQAPEINQIIEHLVTATILIDCNFKIKFANPAAENLLAYSQQKLQQLEIFSFFPMDKETISAIQQCLANATPFSKREALIKSFDQQQHLVDCIISPIQTTFTIANIHFNNNNRSAPVKYLLLELQQQDRMTQIHRNNNLQKNLSVTQLLTRGLAHEIKNPLGGIRGAAQLLERTFNAEDPRQKHTQIIIQETKRLSLLVDRMLSPNQQLQLNDVNIHEIIERVINLLKQDCENFPKLIRDYDISIPDLAADADQLLQAILNVIQNALQAITETSQSQPIITIKTRIWRQLTIGTEKYRLGVNLQIQDNGPGVPDKLKDSLFYPMVSDRINGNGLGLFIAQNIIHQHNGLIECDSSPGHTIFSIKIPINSAAKSLYDNK